MSYPTCSVVSFNPRTQFKISATAETAIKEKPEDNSDPLEKAIAEKLWHWAFSSNEVRSEITKCVCRVSSKDFLQCHLATNLEYYLCGIFNLVSYTRSRGIWCDGVAELSIEKTSRLSFLIVAAAYCPHALAPVELEFHFPVRRSDRPIRVLFRFDDPAETGRTTARGKVILKRPKQDRDWTVAVELTNLDS